MPIYVYIHPKTNKKYEDFRSMSRCDEPYIAPDGVSCQRDKTPCWEGCISISNVVQDRSQRKEQDHIKRVKDPERAMKNRKDMFGTSGVSITKSENYYKEKRIKAKGKTSDINKSEFIKAAAKNPKAVQAAIRTVTKSST